MDKELIEILKKDIVKKEFNDKEKDIIQKVSLILGTYSGKINTVINDLRIIDEDFSKKELLATLLTLLVSNTENTDEMLKVIEDMRKVIIDLDTKLNKGIKNRRKK